MAQGSMCVNRLAPTVGSSIAIRGCPLVQVSHPQTVIACCLEYWRGVATLGSTAPLEDMRLFSSAPSEPVGISVAAVSKLVRCLYTE